MQNLQKGHSIVEHMEQKELVRTKGNSYKEI